MFKKTIGKKCDTDGCALKGQLQELGPTICPECGADLKDVTVDNKRAQALVAIGVALAGSVLGLVAYGYVAKALNPLQMVQLLLRRTDVSDMLQSATAADWVEARARFYNEAGPLPNTNAAFLHEVKDGRHTSTLREHVASKTMIAFDVRRATPAVSTLYFLHTDGRQARILFGGADAFDGRGTIAIPGDDGSGKELGISLVGEATEHFVLIAARKPLPSLDALKAKAAEAALPDADVTAVVAPLEHDSDAYVLHVYVPHS